VGLLEFAGDGERREQGVVISRKARHILQAVMMKGIGGGHILVVLPDWTTFLVELELASEATLILPLAYAAADSKGAYRSTLL
jgi:hypothetical protein